MYSSWPLIMTDITPREAITWLEKASRYFEQEAVTEALSGEDRAYWSNVYNAENARKIAEMIRTYQEVG